MLWSWRALEPRTPTSDPETPALGVDDALEQLLEGLEPFPPVRLPLEEALGLVLAESLVSREIHPAEDTSAMDGYAVQAEDLGEASLESPVRLRLLEDVRAGSPPQFMVDPGTCSRISTGALVPKGADAVEMREYVSLEGDEVLFMRPITPRANIRFAGEHLQVGEQALSAGAVLGPAELGMAAYLGASELLCHPRLSVAILATGSELVGDGGELSRGQIRDSNGISLEAAARNLGCSVVMRQRVADEAEALDQAITEAGSKAQVLLTSGGISAGWHDLVRERIEKSGGVFTFHKLRMRPGKPVAFGKIGSLWVFCLPGNPVSSLVTFEVFVKPALLKLMGRQPEARTVQAELSEAVHKKKGFTVFFRVRLETTKYGTKTARLSGPQESHQLKSLVWADGLMKVGEEVETLEAGSQVEVHLFR